TSGCVNRFNNRTGQQRASTIRYPESPLNDHTDRGVGGRQYGSSEDIETLQGKNNASPSRFRAVEECCSSLARRSELARIIRPCHRRIYRVVLFRTTSCI